MAIRSYGCAYSAVTMGIPKLTSFMDRHFTRWQSRELKGRLVIDGYNIMHHLWRCDWTHGGQLDEFKDGVKGFYERLQEGGVKPIVVLDGITHIGIPTKNDENRKFNLSTRSFTQGWW